ncbi:hypothetical protein [Nocardia sp. R7R-8]
MRILKRRLSDVIFRAMIADHNAYEIASAPYAGAARVRRDVA